MRHGGGLMSSEVEGWLEPGAAKAIDFLLQFQHARELVGDLMEIGVYDGKLFLVLAKNAGSLETCVAIDIFESEEPAIPSVRGVRSRFEANLKKYAPQTRTVIMESNSATLVPHDVRMAMQTTTHSPFRFISIDGCHDADSVKQDLNLSASLLMAGGVIALDDWAPDGNKQWPGVAEGETAFQVMTHGEDLIHIGAIPNKLLLTNDPFWRTEYQRVLKDLEV